MVEKPSGDENEGRCNHGNRIQEGGDRRHRGGRTRRHRGWRGPLRSARDAGHLVVALGGRERRPRASRRKLIMTLPVMPSQADVLWDQERAGTPSNNLGFVLTFGPDISDARVVRGLEAVISVFAAFRIRCSGSAESGYSQEILPPSEPADIELLDVADFDLRRVDRYLQAVLYRDSVAWDWQRRGTYRFRVLKADQGVHHVAASLQHVAFDHRSVQIVLDSIRDFALTSDEKRRTTTDSDDYEKAVRATIPNADASERARAYWENELSTVPAAFSVPFDSRPAPWHRQSLVLEGDDYTRFRERAGTSTWGAAALLLERLLDEWRERQPSAAVVDVRLNCRPPRFEKQVGMFATTRPLVFDLVGTEWRSRVWSKLMRAAVHQCVDSITLRAIEEGSGIGAHRPIPVFDYVVDTESSTSSALHSPGTDVRRVPFRPRSVTYRPMGLSVRERGGSVAIQLGLNSRLFNQADVTTMLNRIAGR
ncbi:condensation domain-containing protein [Nocardia sp. NPDC004168]|uniref:condensation domain-containing protein n=1 Tax=Nocardia sp. NPDC004168 TaxID=3154452 RepID=UPI0033A6321D